MSADKKQFGLEKSRYNNRVVVLIGWSCGRVALYVVFYQSSQGFKSEHPGEIQVPQRPE